MPSQKNINQLKTIQEKISQAKSIVLADYKGLSVAQQDELRKKVKQVNAELMVAKNTLIKLALKQEKISLPKNLETALQGPTITLFAYEDEIAPIKALAEFAKDNKLPEIKAGFLNKNPLSAEQVNQLAKLPTKVELLAKTVATIKTPLSGIVNVLSANLKNLVYALEAIQNQKSNN